MGMAASQARLLTLTSRLHDVELKAQNIESQKIALATQKDALYSDYCDALDAKKIQVAFMNNDGSKSYVDATYATVCGYSDSRSVQYSLTDARTGQVIVDEKTAQMYEDYGNDKYGFAWAMLGMDGNECWDGESYGDCVGYGTSPCTSDGNLWMTEVEQMVFDKYVGENDTLSKAYDKFTEIDGSDEASDSEKRQALQDFRDTLYDLYGSEIYKYMRLNKGDSAELNGDPDASGAVFDDEYPEAFPQGEFNYYIRLFEQIDAAGGCQVISAEYESGDGGKTWFNNMVNAGLVIISELDTTDKNPQWTETSVATSTNGNYLRETQDDTDLKKAEAEYEYELGVINRKDTKFDNELSKLETERTSITTEIDSLKKVRDDNIERTFGIFS